MADTRERKSMRVAFCFTCGLGERTLRCTNCEKAFYCCEECQKIGWKKHKHFCKKRELIGRNSLCIYCRRTITTNASFSCMKCMSGVHEFISKGHSLVFPGSKQLSYLERGNIAYHLIFYPESMEEQKELGIDCKEYWDGLWNNSGNEDDVNHWPGFYTGRGQWVIPNAELVYRTLCPFPVPIGNKKGMEKAAATALKRIGIDVSRNITLRICVYVKYCSLISETQYSDEKCIEIETLKKRLEKAEDKLFDFRHENYCLKNENKMLQEKQKKQQQEIKLSSVLCNSIKEYKILLEESYQLSSKLTKDAETNELRLKESRDLASQLSNTLQSMEGYRECVVCNVENSIYASTTCGHLCACSDCHAGLLDRPCPLCRVNITTFIRIY